MEQQNREQDSDLYALWKIIVKRKIIIIGIFFVSVIAAAVISSFTQQIYQGETVLRIFQGNLDAQFDSADNKTNITAIRPNEEVIGIINVIGSIDKEKIREILPKTHSSVKMLQLKPVRGSRNKIIVTIEAKSTNDILLAMAELVSFLNGLDIVKLTVKEKKEILLRKSEELSKLDKIAAELLIDYDKLRKAGKLLQLGFDPLRFYKGLIDIRLEKEAIDQALRKLEAEYIKILKPPNIPHKPISPQTAKNVFLAGILSLFIGIPLAFVMEYLKRIKHSQSISK